MTPRDRDSHIIATLQRGLTRKEVALRFGVRYWVIAKAARRWEMAGGAPLPRNARGRPRQSLHTVTDRERDVVADYRSPEHPTMEALGARYGISKERVRQLIVSYELKTGDKVLRVTAHLSGRQGVLPRAPGIRRPARKSRPLPEPAEQDEAARGVEVDRRKPRRQ